MDEEMSSFLGLLERWNLYGWRRAVGRNAAESSIFVRDVTEVGVTAQSRAAGRCDGGVCERPIDDIRVRWRGDGIMHRGRGRIEGV